MEFKDIKDVRLRGLIAKAKNAGGELELIVEDALSMAKDEKEFELNWFLNVRNYMSRVGWLYNELSERNGYERVEIDW